MPKPKAGRPAQSWRGEREEGLFLDVLWLQWEMNLVTGAFSSHPSSSIPCTTLLGVQWQLSKTQSLKTRMACFLDGVGTVERNKSLSRHAKYWTSTTARSSSAWTARRLPGAMSASLLWLKGPFQPPKDLRLPIYMHVHKSAVCNLWVPIFIIC